MPSARRSLPERSRAPETRDRAPTSRELAAYLVHSARRGRADILELFADNQPSEQLREFQELFATEGMPKPAQFADTLAQIGVWAFLAIQCGEQTFSSGDSVATQDPVAHLYESFLAAYDPALRKACGVYSTPQPITSFIVRAVDDLLQSRFGISAGLAEQGTRPRVVMVDPACGTGNFLCSVVRHIRERFLQQHHRQAWLRYVRRSLLPRLHGFELLLASSTIAHLQLFRQFDDLDLDAEQIGVHLTSSLEEMAEKVDQILAAPDAPARSPSALARRAQRDTILVVLGNPPYRGISRTCSDWMARLLQSYRQVEGGPLGEKKVWLKNDYVQFIRFGQWAIEQAGQGILALVTDHSYLDSATFRGMRHCLLQTFDEINVLNLHGNAKRRERTPDGNKDENVFDIRQGVAIALFIKHRKPAARSVNYQDVWGSRQSKYAYLAESRVGTMGWKTITPAAPSFELVPVERQIRAEYERGWLMKEIFPVGSNGVQTSRDRLVVAFCEADLRQRVECFLRPAKTEQAIRREFFATKAAGRYPPGDTREWRLSEARRVLRQNRSWRRAITIYSYRPFDERCVLYLDAMIDWPRRSVMRHLQRPNYALCVGRAGLVASRSWDLVFCVDQICDHNLFYRGSSINFPLYLYPEGDLPKNSCEEMTRVRPNLSATFLNALCATLSLRFVADQPGDLRRTVGPENLLHYAYAVLHAPSYRRRYAEFLKYDFPRLPLTTDLQLFRALCVHGEALVQCHLLRKNETSGGGFPVPGDNRVQNIRYLERNRVWINATQYFEGVPPEVWQFSIGGYQVCQKWLRDRKGRVLTAEDQDRYLQIIAALSASIRLQRDIDTVIEEHGGWPIASV
jgi:predicted helicase